MTYEAGKRTVISKDTKAENGCNWIRKVPVLLRGTTSEEHRLQPKLIVSRKYKCKWNSCLVKKFLI